MAADLLTKIDELRFYNASLNGAWFAFDYLIINEGDMSADNFEAQLLWEWFGGSNSSPSTVTVTGPLQPGNTTEGVFSNPWFFPTDEGDYFFKFVVDSDDDVAEADETNNESAPFKINYTNTLAFDPASSTWSGAALYTLYTYGPGWTLGWNVGWYNGWGLGWHYGWYNGWGFGWNLGWYFDGKAWAYGWNTGWYSGWHLGWNLGWHVGWHYGWNDGWHIAEGWNFTDTISYTL
ncbi:MAG: CARDB domain-containing protein [Pseudomonadota bacterium]